MVRKKVAEASKTHGDSSFYSPLRFYMTKDHFVARLERLTIMDMFQILFAFKLVSPISDQDVPRGSDDRFNVNSIQYMIGENILFPLSK